MKIAQWVLSVVAGVGIAACGPPEEEPFCKASGGATECKDADQCTVDSCNESARKCEFKIAVGTTCDDGDACTAADKCGEKGCLPGTKKDCDDGKQCTENEKCDPSTGACANKPQDGACNDGDKCTKDDACAEGKCEGGAKVPSDDKNPCTKDSCDPKEGVKNEPIADGACDDGDACTSGDKCDASGTCKPGAAVVQDDKNPCTKDSCDPKKGVTNVAIADGPCDDGDKCTEADKCDSAGSCKPGSTVKKDDGNPCTKDACDPKVGVTNEAIVDGPCDDDDKCTEGDKCDAKAACKPGAAVKKDDGNPCTTDTCDKAKGVINEPNTEACEDGNACTVGDKCADKQCKSGSQLECPDKDGNFCTLENCDKLAGCVTTKAADGAKCTDNDKCTENDVCANGQCLPGTAKKCADDGDVCTAEYCDSKLDCTWKAGPDGKECTDNSACTDGDTCKGGACIKGPKVECNDNNPCTDDVCDAKAGCKYTANTLPCEDGSKCTIGDQCKNSACSPGAAKACDDQKECTVDSCDPVSGNCGTFNAKDGNACDDGDKCSEKSTCKTGQCVAADKVTCKDDGNPCTNDDCDKASGCAYPAQPGSCNADDNVCTDKDSCAAGKCVPGNVLICDDKNACTDDSCDPLKGCLNLTATADGKPCDDGLMCTEGDKCKDGKCAVNTPKNCSDGNDCTEDSCDAKTGCGSVNSLLGSSCSDVDACSTGDACDGKGACKSTGPALWTLKDGTSLQDRYFGAAVGPDGTIVSVGSMYTGLPVVAKLTGRKPDKSIAFETKLQKAGSEQWLNAIQPAPKGRYIAVGQADVDNTGWTAYRNYAVQINANGVIEWEYAGKPSGYASYFSDVAVAPTGAVAMVGVAYGAPNGYLAAATSAESNWIPDLVDQQYPPPSGFKAQYFRAVAHAPAGGYWVGGMILYGSNNGGAARILRIQPGGGVTFDKVFGKDNGSWQNSYHLVADKDGVTSFGDSTNGIYGGEDSWIVRIDNNNKVVYEVHLGGAGNDSIRNAIAAPDGGFIVAGYSTLTGENLAKAFLGRVDSSGLLEWQRTLDQPDSRWRGIALTPAGSFAVAGYTNFETKGDNDTLLATCDLYGNCECASSGTCLTKATAACDDKNPCTLDWCDKGTCQHANGNENQMCDTNSTTKTCQKGKCL